MIRKKIAELAMATENRISSFKVNQKICIVLAAIISLTSITISSVKFNSSSTTALAMSDAKNSSVTILPTTTKSVFNSNNNYGLCKIEIVKHDKKPQALIIRETTVRKALETAHVVLSNYDVVNFDLSKTIYNNMKIVIKEVKYKNENKSEKLTLKKFRKKYPNEDSSKLNENGKVLVNKTVKVKYVNGKRKSSKVSGITYKSVDIVKPVAAKGVKKYSELKTISELKPKTNFKLNKKGIPINYSKKITGTASAYSCGTHTATGKRVKPGYIAVNPKQIPYGTKLFIRSSDGNYIYGYASAEDTGGFVKWGNTVADLFFWSESDCMRFGRRSIEIYVLD